MRWPLRNQIMFPVLAVAAISLAAVAVVNARLATNRTAQQIEDQLSGVVAVLSRSSFPLTDAVLRQMRDLSRAEFVLLNAAQETIASTLRDVPAELSDMPRPAHHARNSLRETLTASGRRYFHSTTELGVRSGAEKGLTLHILFPEAEYRRAWREAFVPPLLIGVATAGVIAAVAQLLAGRLSRKTSRLGAEVLRLARGDFAPMELPATDDEVRDLSIAINQTAGMLADYEGQIRRVEQLRTVSLLGAGLAHELRNSATGCLVAIDLHLESCPVAKGDDALAVVKRQLRLMETQLQRLLAVGKTPATGEVRACDLASLVDELLLLVRPAALHAGATLEWNRPPREVWASVGQDSFGSVVVSLILNAIEAVQQLPLTAERRVNVSLRESEAETHLIVSDTGLGLQDEAASTVFEPFVTTKPEGIGLGLATARQVIQSFHGGIEWTRENGVTSFRITLPSLTATKGVVRV